MRTNAIVDASFGVWSAQRTLLRLICQLPTGLNTDRSLTVTALITPAAILNHGCQQTVFRDNGRLWHGERFYFTS